MCNNYEQHVTWAAYSSRMRQLERGIPTRQSDSDLPQADDVRIGDTGPVMRVACNVVGLVPMKGTSWREGTRGYRWALANHSRASAPAGDCINVSGESK